MEHSGQRVLQGARLRLQDIPGSPREPQKQKMIENTSFGSFWTEGPAGLESPRELQAPGLGSRSSQKQSEAARCSQEQPEAARSSQKQPEAARSI